MIDHFNINSNDFDGPVFVTGAAGCIGSWVVALLVKANVTVIAFDLSADKNRLKLLMNNEEIKKIKWITGNVAETESVSEAVKNNDICSIIHLAALQVPFCIANPVEGAKVNVIGTINILEAARHNKLKRLTYASSIASHSLTPKSPYMSTLYGAYKLCDENIASIYYQDWNVPSIGIRPGIIYGIGRDQGLTSKTTIATLAAAAGIPYTIPFSGAISALHAGEAAAAFIKAAAIKQDEAPVFDLNGTSTTVEEWVKIINSIEPDSRIHITGDSLPFPSNLSDQPIHNYLGKYDKVDFKFGIKQTFTSFRNLLSLNAISTKNLS